MSIYRSAAGAQTIRSWATDRLDAWDHPHLRRSLPTTSGMTHVVTTGTGPEVVMLAGTNFASATWLPLIADLSQTHRVHAIDLPGQPGLSAPDRPRHAGRRYGEWLAQILASLASPTDAPIVVGHSLGAAVALRAAAQGSPMAGLVLLDPAGLMRLRVTPSLMRATLPWLRRPDADRSRGLLRMMMAPTATPPEDMVAWMTLVGRHVRTSLAPSPVSAGALLGISAPTRILTGRHDVFLPPGRLGTAAQRRLHDVEVVVIEDAGHLLPHERPDVVAHAIRTLSTQVHTPTDLENP